MMRSQAIQLAAAVLLCVGATAAAQTPGGGTTEGVALTQTNGEFTLNFKDAEIRALIATVSELTGRNFVVDPRVKGEVTVLSSHAMTPDELYETFLSVLEVHGFAAVPAGAVTKIVPQVNAKQNGGFGRDITTPEDIITRVIQVSNVPAAQLVPILRPLVPQYGHLAAYPASNILIISDRKANVARIERIVNRIDQEGNRRVEIIQLEHAYAGEVVQTIRKLKTNAKQNAPNSANFTVIADERTNSVILAAGPEMRLRVHAIIADLDTPIESQGNTKVVYLDYADAEKLATILQKFSEGQSQQTTGEGAPNADDVSVIAAKGINALVINAPPSTMRKLRQIVDKLDIRRGQVLIEAIIAEVSLNQSRDLGINVGVLSDGVGVAASILDKSTLQVVPAIASGSLPLNLIQQGLNLALGYEDNGDGFGALLRAFAGNSRTNVLSTPSLVTRDNVEAEISVGKEVPFVTGSFTTAVNGGAGGVNPFQTIERRDVGLTLNLTPQINAGNTIQLDLELEVSSIAKGAQGAADLITNKRTLKTSVTVESGQILVLGGLIDTHLTEGTQKVPILSDIPIIGALFTTHDVDRVKRNLLNFIRPTILRGHGAADYYTRQKYEYMRRVQQAQTSSIPLLPDAHRPVLPPIERYLHTPVFPDTIDAANHPNAAPTNATNTPPSLSAPERQQYQR